MSGEEDVKARLDRCEERMTRLLYRLNAHSRRIRKIENRRVRSDELSECLRLRMARMNVERDKEDITLDGESVQLDGRDVSLEEVAACVSGLEGRLDKIEARLDYLERRVNQVSIKVDYNIDPVLEEMSETQDSFRRELRDSDVTHRLEVLENENGTLKELCRRLSRDVEELKAAR